MQFAYRPVFARLPASWHRRLQQSQPITPEIVVLHDVTAQHFRSAPVRRIIVLKLDHIGDMILGMRALQTIREGFPDAHITLVVASWNAPLARRLPYFDRIVCFDFFTPRNRDWLGTSGDLQALYRRFQALPLESYDLAVDIRHDADTRPCLYRLDARFRAGFFAPPESGLPQLDLMVPASEGLTAGPVPDHSMHCELRLHMLALTVVAAFAPPRPHPALALAERRPLRPARGFAVLAVGAGDPIRCWPIDRFGELGHALITRHGLDVFALGGVADQADVARLAALLPEGRVRTLVGAALTELPSVLAEASLCVCNGSGMSHFAASLGVPTVCILGGTTRMEVWRPTGPHAIAIGGRTPCQPCGLREADQCPWDVACLTSVQTSHVLEACERLLHEFDAEPSVPVTNTRHAV